MYKYLLQILVFYISLFIAPNMVMAIDYTTKKNNEAVKEQCSRDDLRMIKKANYRAKIKLKEYKAVEATAPDVKTPKDAKKFSEEMTRAKAFFESDKFKEMETIYKRCNMKMPTVNSGTLFWQYVEEEKEEEKAK